MTDEDFKSLDHIFDKECVKFLEKNLNITKRYYYINRNN